MQRNIFSLISNSILDALFVLLGFIVNFTENIEQTLPAQNQSLWKSSIR